MEIFIFCFLVFWLCVLLYVFWSILKTPAPKRKEIRKTTPIKIEFDEAMFDTNFNEDDFQFIVSLVGDLISESDVNEALPDNFILRNDIIYAGKFMVLQMSTFSGEYYWTSGTPDSIKQGIYNTLGLLVCEHLTIDSEDLDRKKNEYINYLKSIEGEFKWK